MRSSVVRPAGGRRAATTGMRTWHAHSFLQAQPGQALEISGKLSCLAACSGGMHSSEGCMQVPPSSQCQGASLLTCVGRALLNLKVRVGLKKLARNKSQGLGMTEGRDLVRPARCTGEGGGVLQMPHTWWMARSKAGGVRCLCRLPDLRWQQGGWNCAMGLFSA
jgi:hypothetical protein